MEHILSDKSDDDIVVKITGSQTIAGLKEFSNNATFKGVIDIEGSSPSLNVKRIISGSEGSIILSNSSLENRIWSTDGFLSGKRLSIRQGVNVVYNIEANGNHDFISGDMVTTGNITASNFIGSGSQLTNISFNNLTNKPQFDSIPESGSNNAVSSSGIFDALATKNPLISHLEFNDNDKTVWNNGKGNIATNTSFGEGALKFNTVGIGNTAKGFDALQSNTTGNYNLASGINALYSNTEGNNNTGIGGSVLLANTTGDNNTAVGRNALQLNTIGNDNTANGSDALSSNTTGNRNTANGKFALSSNTTGNNNTAIGNFANVSAGNLTNATAIGNGAIVNASNKVQLGNASVTEVATSGTVTAAEATLSTHLATKGQLDGGLALKINNADIVNNVTAGGVNVPLSAEQGKILKEEILALEGSLIAQGNWNANTNTPNISSTTETGYYWIVSVSGSTNLGGITDWKEPDWAIKTATGWAQIDNTDKVLSVNGRIGAVGLDSEDVGLANVNNTSDANKPVSTAQQNALNSKANNTTQIIAGTGLTGGGNLTTNRTLNVTYGTTSGTAAQGTDGRINNGQTAFDWGNHALAGYLTTTGNGSQLTSVNADTIDSTPFRNSNSSDPVSANSVNSNGTMYYNAGVDNFAGTSTDGALYSAIHSTSWQHQIAGDFRTGQIALRGKNSNVWQSWRKVLDEGNFGKIQIDALGLNYNDLANKPTIPSVSNSTITINTGNGLTGGGFFTLNGGATTLNLVNSSPNIVQTTITGNAGTATALQNARLINGVSFNGTANITIVDSTKEPAFSKNTAFNKNFGTVTGTVTVGNDARLSNVRNPIINYNNNSNSNFQMVWGDGNVAYGTAGVTVNPSNNSIRVSNYEVTPGDGNGIRFWASDSYKISMGNIAEYKYGPVTDYSIKTQMDTGSPNRGFTWGRSGLVPVAAINATSGNMQIAGTMTATSFIGNGSPLTNVNATQLGGVASSGFATTSALNGKANNTITITTGTGMTGGGNLTANRTFNVTYGTTAGTAAQGNDGRLSNVRNPIINYNNNSNSNFQMVWGSGNVAYGTAGVTVNPSTNTITASNLNANGIVGVVADGAANDPYGKISVTRGTASNFAYYGLTRAGQVGWSIGVNTSNEFIIGTGAGGANIITSVPFRLSVGGNLTANNFIGNGSQLTNVNAAQLGGVASSGFATTSALNLKANNSITITTGTGMTGGGNLTANRTFNVTYGTAAGTAAQGNDARLSDVRNPIITYNNNFNSNFQMLFGSGNAAFGTAAVTVNPATNIITAANFVLGSDRRLKTKVKNLKGDSINAVWKSFELKANKGDYRIGVIAQELELTNPEFVITDDKGMKSVKYIDLLVAKMAEKDKQISDLEDRLLKLESLIK